MKIELSEDNILNPCCAAPFVQMLLAPNGDISPCCWNQKIVFGNINKQGLLEIWNSQEAQNLREEFLEGNITLCSEQIKHIGCHHFSRHLAKDIQLSKVLTKLPKRLDVRLNGKCNLECIMCDVWKGPNGIYDESFFWQQGPDKIFPNLQEIDVLGGEPFIQPDTYRLITEVSKVNSKCSWAFVTNGNYRLHKGVLKKLDLINIRWIQVSIDSLRSDTFSKIRHKGNLKLVLESLEGFRKYNENLAHKKKFEINASFCVQKLNMYEVYDFYEFCESRSITPLFQMIYEKIQPSLFTLPIEEKLKYLSFINDKFQGESEKHIAPIKAPLVESLPEKLQMEFSPKKNWYFPNQIQ